MYRDFHVFQNNALHTDALSRDDDDNDDNDEDVVLQIPSEKLSVQFGTWISGMRSQFL